MWFKTDEHDSQTQGRVQDPRDEAVLEIGCVGKQAILQPRPQQQEGEFTISKYSNRQNKDTKLRSYQTAGLFGRKLNKIYSSLKPFEQLKVEMGSTSPANI